MPFKSKSQQKLFFAKEERGELPKGTAERWANHTKDIKALPEHVKKASDLLSYTHDSKPGHIVKIALSMENPDATIDAMLEPSWNQRDNPYMDQPGGFSKQRMDGGPHTTFANKIKKDIMAGSLMGAGAAIGTIPVRHLVNPKSFATRSALIKHLALGTLGGASAGTLFAAADTGLEKMHKKAADDSDKSSVLKRSAKGALWESIAGAGGAAVEAPVSKYIFKEKTHLGGGNLMKRIGAGAAIGGLMGIGGGALGIYGGKGGHQESEEARVQRLLGKTANDVYNTSNGMDFLGSDKDPAEAMPSLNHVASKKPTYPIVSDGEGLSDRINKFNTPGGQTSI